jgi:ATP-binding protein involved in chromosome partitioning
LTVRGYAMRGDTVKSQTDPAERMRLLEERKQRLAERMALIKHKLIVLSGKGGVGKSTVAAYLATALAARGKSVGLLDVDIHGPSIPKMLGIEDRQVGFDDNAIIPIPVSTNLKAMSIAFLLRSKRDAVIWRGPLKMGIIEEFLANVDWGPLDYLIIDSPPGTGDEPLSVCQLIEGLDGAIVIATPQEIALADVEKSITFCRQVHVRVIGVVENMSGFVCPHCGKSADIFRGGGAERLATSMGVPFLGRLPLVPEVVEACDRGECTIASVTHEALKRPLNEIADKVVARDEPTSEALPRSHTPSESSTDSDPLQAPGTGASGVRPASTRRIALPVNQGRVSTHFGHSSEFVIFKVEGGEIVSEETVTPPPHAPGVIPSWLKQLGVNTVIASGLGQRAIAMFEDCGVSVVCGAAPEPPRKVVAAFLEGRLVTGENICDH